MWHRPYYLYLGCRNRYNCGNCGRIQSVNTTFFTFLSLPTNIGWVNEYRCMYFTVHSVHASPPSLPHSPLPHPSPYPTPPFPLPPFPTILLTPRPPSTARDLRIKGKVRRKLRWVKTGINRQLFLYCLDPCIFFFKYIGTPYFNVNLTSFSMLTREIRLVESMWHLLQIP
jgi:hypothetical protein